MNTTKLILAPEYFTNAGYKLPKMLKRLRNETDVTYEMRIKNYLLNMGDTQFTRVADLIDPEHAM